MADTTTTVIGRGDFQQLIEEALKLERSLGRNTSNAIATLSSSIVKLDNNVGQLSTTLKGTFTSGETFAATMTKDAKGADQVTLAITNTKRAMEAAAQAALRTDFSKVLNIDPNASLQQIQRIESAFERVIQVGARVGITGQDLNRAFDLIKQGATSAALGVDNNLVAALRRLAIEQERAKSKTTGTLVPGEDPFKGGLPVLPAGASLDSLVAVENALKKVQEAFKNTSKTAKDLENDFNKLRDGGTKAVQDLTVPQIKALDDLRRAREQAAESTRSEAERRAQAEKLVQQALDSVGLSQKRLAQIQQSNPFEANKIRNQINSLTESLIKGEISALQFKQALDAIKNGDFGSLIGGAREAAALIGSLNAESQRTKPILFDMRESFRLMLAALIKRTPFFLFEQIKTGIKDVIQFETAILKVQVALTDFSKEGAKLEGAFSPLSRRLSELSIEFGQARKEVADTAFEVFASNIFKGIEATQALETSLKLARTTFSDASNAARTLATSIGAFGLAASDQQKVASLLFGAVSSSKSSLADIERFISQTAVSARSLGLSIEELLGTFVSLRQQGIPTQRAITTISNVFNRLITSGTAVNDLFAKQGFESAAQATKVLGLQKVLELLAETSEKGTGRNREFAQSILGIDNEGKILIGSIEKLTDKSKEFGKVNEEVQKQHIEQLKRAQQEWSNLRARVVEDITVISSKVLSVFKIGVTPDLNIEAGVQRLNRELSKIGEKTGRTDDIFKEIDTNAGLAFASIRAGGLVTFQSLRQNFQLASRFIREDFKNMGDLAQAIARDSNAAITDSVKQNFNTLQEFNKRAFEQRISPLQPQQQFPLIQERFNELEKQRKALIETGSVEANREANKILKEQLDLVVKIEQLNNQQALSAGRQQVAIDKVTQSLFNQLQDISQRTQTQNGNLREQLKLKQDLLTAGIKSGSIDAATAKAQSQALQNQEKAAIASSRAQVQAAQDIINILERESAVRRNINPTIEANIQNQIRGNRLIVTHAQQQLESFVAVQAYLRDAAKGFFDEVNALSEKSKTQIDEVKKKIQEANANETVFVTKQRDAIKSLFETVEKARFDFAKRTGATDAALTVSGVRNQINKDIAGLKTLVEEALEKPTATNIQAALDEARPKVTELASRLSALKTEPSEALKKAVEDTVKAFKELDKLVITPDFETPRKELNKQLEDLQKKTKGIAGTISEEFTKAAGSSNTLKQGVDNFNSALNVSVRKLDEILRKFEDIKKKAAEIKIPELKGKVGQIEPPERIFVNATLLFDSDNLESTKVLPKSKVPFEVPIEPKLDSPEDTRNKINRAIEQFNQGLRNTQGQNAFQFPLVPKGLNKEELENRIQDFIKDINNFNDALGDKALPKFEVGLQLDQSELDNILNNTEEVLDEVDNVLNNINPTVGEVASKFQEVNSSVTALPIVFKRIKEQIDSIFNNLEIPELELPEDQLINVDFEIDQTILDNIVLPENKIVNIEQQIDQIFDTQQIGLNLQNSIIEGQDQALELQSIFENIANIAANIKIPQSRIKEQIEAITLELNNKIESENNVNIITEINNIFNQINNETQSITSNLIQITNQAKELQNIFNNTNLNNISINETDIDNVFNSISSNVENITNNLNNNLNQIIDQARELQNILNNVSINENQVDNVFTNIQNQLQNISIDNIFNSVNQNVQQIGFNLSNGIVEAENRTFELDNIFNSVNQNVQQIGFNLSNGIVEAENRTFELDNIFNNTSQNVQQIGFNLQSSIIEGQNQAFFLQSIFENIANIAANIRIPQPVPVGVPVFIPSGGGAGFAEGGPVNVGPFGIDKVPAMLTRGEFVVNARDSSRFFSELSLINRGIKPKFFNQGGFVGPEIRHNSNSNQVNVGGITVNLSTTSTNPDTLVRDFANKLDREIRRGNIKFK